MTAPSKAPHRCSHCGRVGLFLTKDGTLPVHRIPEPTRVPTRGGAPKMVRLTGPEAK